MTTQTRATLKTYFETGDKPTQIQFENLIDSFLSLSDTASQTVKSAVTVSGAVYLAGGGTTVTVSADTNNGSFATTACVVSALTPYATTASLSAYIKTVTKQIFTGSGTYTPTANMLYAIIECVGGGGAGGGAAITPASNVAAGGGGEAGWYARKVVTAADVGVSKAVTIGAGGVGGTGSGPAGAASSVGALCVAAGGAGGTGGTATANGAVSAGGVSTGTGTTGDFIGSGEAGGMSFGPFGVNVVALSGKGGNSFYGAGGASKGNASGVGNAGKIYGGGGGGAINSPSQGAAVNGGDGAAGVVVITEFCS